MTPTEIFMIEFGQRAPHFGLRSSVSTDTDFVRRLFLLTEMDTSPLPASLIGMQFESRQQTYADQFPAAMDVLVERDGRPIGRMMVDWEHADGCHAIDLAVLPAERRGAAGLHLLRAWIGTADRLERPAILRVRPAATGVIRLYRQLGFRTTGDREVPVRMVRPQARVRITTIETCERTETQ